MAVGDIVNGVFDINTLLVFRPALGVEIAITSSYNQGYFIMLTDGVISAPIMYTATANSYDAGSKIMINNTIWLTTSTTIPNIDGSTYSGIQLK